MDGFTSQDSSDWQRNIVLCDLSFTFGTNGAIPTTSPIFDYGTGVLSVVSSGGGVYVVTFQAPYAALMGGSTGFIIQASYSSSGADFIKPSADAVATTTPTVTLTCYNAAGAATQPATGDKFRFTFRLKRTKE